MWEPQPLITTWAFTACYRDNFALLFGAVEMAFTFSDSILFFLKRRTHFIIRNFQ
jgi:hypothetical protein